MMISQLQKNRRERQLNKQEEEIKNLLRGKVDKWMEEFKSFKKSK